MALRILARRSGPQVHAMMRPGQQQARALADEYTGRALSDQEKAAETIYIKKKEEEQRLKQASKGFTETPTPASETPAKGAPSTQTAEGGGYRNIAVLAGITALAAGFWMFSGNSKNGEKQSA